MAAKHPYTATTGSIGQVVAQLRKNFPAKVDAGTLKKFSIAPNNESYLINILRFIGVIGENGERSDKGKSVFVKHDDTEFFSAFSDLVQNAYSDLFELFGQDAWNLPTDKLISFFRQADETSDVIGSRQAGSFVALARLSGKRDGSPSSAKKATSPKTTVKPPKVKPAAKTAQASTPLPSTATTHTASTPESASGNVALTVRIEVNLPAGGDQATYDAIFKSIKSNLLP